MIMKKLNELIEQYKKNVPIAYMGLSNFGGIAIVDFIPSIDDYVFGYFDFGNGKEYFLSTFEHDNLNLCDDEEILYFFKIGNCKYYIHEFMKMYTSPYI